MANASFNALIFIPDISGFTKFVNKTSIEHSSAIIKELLEVIMDKNSLGLQLVEIEGDALLYYKKEKNPTSTDKIMEQCKSMFLAFHQHLKLYERDRICNCEACSGTHKLGLKFIVHTGEIVLQQIFDREKIMGKEVILAHRLMKNEVQSDNYILLSDTVGDNESTGFEFQAGTEEYPELGTIPFNFLHVDKWIQETPELPEHGPIKYVSNPVKISIQIEKDIDFVHRFLVSLKHRKEWSPQLVDFIYDEQKIDRIGSAHDCVLPDNIIHITSVTNEQGKEHITYAEKADKLGIIPESFQLFKLKRLDDNSCEVNVEHHIKLFFPLNLLIKPKLKKGLQTGLNEFKRLCESTWSEEDAVII